MRLAFIRRRSRFEQRLMRLLPIGSKMRRTEGCSFQLRWKFGRKKIKSGETANLSVCLWFGYTTSSKTRCKHEKSDSSGETGSNCFVGPRNPEIPTGARNLIFELEDALRWILKTTDVSPFAARILRTFISVFETLYLNLALGCRADEHESLFPQQTIQSSGSRFPRTRTQVAQALWVPSTWHCITDSVVIRVCMGI